VGFDGTEAERICEDPSALVSVALTSENAYHQPPSPFCFGEAEENRESARESPVQDPGDGVGHVKPTPTSSRLSSWIQPESLPQTPPDSSQETFNWIAHVLARTADGRTEGVEVSSAQFGQARFETEIVNPWPAAVDGMSRPYDMPVSEAAW